MRQDPCVIVNQSGHFFAYWVDPSIPSHPAFTTSPELAHQYYNASTARRTLRRLDPVYGEGINYRLVRYSQCHNARYGEHCQPPQGGIIDSMQTTEKNSESIQVAPGVVVRRMGQLQRIDRRQRAYWIDAYAVYVDHLEWQPWTGKREAMQLARKIAAERKAKQRRRGC